MCLSVRVCACVLSGVPKVQLATGICVCYTAHFDMAYAPASSSSCSLACLMDEAESRSCAFILIFFDRGLPLDQVKQIMRTFQFIGFQNLAPNSPMVPNQATKYHFMVYSIDS